DGGRRRARRHPAAAARLHFPAPGRPRTDRRRRQGVNPARGEARAMRGGDALMPDRRILRPSLSRRDFLATSTFAAAGLGLVGLTPARAAETSVSFAGWAFEPQVVEANLKRFMEQNKDLKVEYTPLDLQLYREKMVALF